MTAGKGAADTVFDDIFRASQYLISDEQSVEANDIAIRLLDRMNQGHFSEENGEAINYLVNRTGLYPYADATKLGFIDSTIQETHRIRGMPEIIFHREQMRILQLLLSGKNVALSAPTSFGKSIIIDAYINLMRPQNVVVIQPSLALVDETRRRLIKSFSRTYKIVSSPEEEAADRSIFVLTPERFASRQDVADISFLFIDEFYKYRGSKERDRQPAFSLCLYNSTAKARQVFLAAPHVDRVDFGPLWNEKIIFDKTDFRTVATNSFDRSDSERASSALLQDLIARKFDQNLVFSATPRSCTDLAAEMAAQDVGVATDLARDVADWLSEQYSPDWSVARLLRKGVGVHHGRLPRSISQLIIKLFNAGDISCLFCTSTLIEGVNTTAKNVFIFDKTINGKDSLDYFTLQNIRGRAGRMLKHYVGNVYTYFELPKPDTQEVVADALKSPEDADPYVLFNLPDQNASSSMNNKKLEILGKTGLSSSIISEHGSLGLERLAAIRFSVNKVLNEDAELLNWHGAPSSNEQYAVLASIILRNTRRFFGLKGSSQLVRALKKLHRSRSLEDFVSWFSKTFWAGETTGVDHCFAFLRQCEYSIPSIIRATEDIARDLEPDMDINYKSFANEVENWFRSPLVRHTEEIGIPFAISERYIDRYRGRALDGLMAYIFQGMKAEEWSGDVERFISADILQSYIQGQPAPIR